MFERRLDIDGTLELLSPLHIGTGDRDRRAGIRDPEDPSPEAAKGVWVGTAITAEDGRPCIPGATIKGMLRRAVGAGDERDILFGTARGDAGVIGRVTAWTARATTIPKDCRLPHYDPNTGLYVHARVRLDPATGVAAKAKLFHRETAARGTRFALRLSVNLTDDNTQALAEPALPALWRALADLAGPDGMPCGRGKGKGDGRLRLLADTLRVTERGIGEDGAAVTRDRSAEVRAAVQRPAAADVLADLELVCEGPFLSIDSSNFSQRGKGRPAAASLDDATETADQIEPVQDVDAGPLVSGTGVMGALRARARWRAAVEHLRATGKAEPQDQERTTAPALDEMTVVERLFGTVGHAGRLRIRALSVVDSGRVERLTSVSLDPFSGAPIDGALFTTAAFVGTRLRLSLALDAREDYPQALAAEDADFARRLIEDLETQGLMLGHGVNKGFGWFTVTSAAAERKAAE